MMFKDDTLVIQGKRELLALLDVINAASVTYADLTGTTIEQLLERSARDDINDGVALIKTMQPKLRERIYRLAELEELVKVNNG